MAETISAEDRQSIIITAIQVAGKGATSEQVSDEVKRIAGLLREGSPAHAAFDELDRIAERTVSIDYVKGTIIGVGVETLNKGVQRGVIMLSTAVSKHSPEGKEHFRSDILGDPTENTPSRQLMRQASSLIGSRVILEKHLEKKADGGGETVRVARGLKAQGADENYDIHKVEYQPLYDPQGKQKDVLIRATMQPRVPVLENA